MISNTFQKLIFLDFTRNNIRNIENVSGVYMIKNILNNKCYIGSSINVKRRLQTHICHLNKGMHHNRHLQAAYNKYGQKAFQFVILEICEPIIDTILSLEQKYLDLNPEYNNAPIAGSNNGYKHSAETKKKMSNSRTGKPKIYTDREYVHADVLKNPNYINKNRLTPVCKLNLNGELLQEYDSIASAARDIDRKAVSIKDVCTGKQITAYGFKWKYKKDMEEAL